MNNRKKVFFIAYGGSHIKLLLPLITKLKSLDVFNILIFGLPGSIPDLKKNDLDYITYLNFISDIPAEYFSNHIIDEIVEKNHNLSFDFSKEESKAYLVINVWNYAIKNNLTFSQAATEISSIGRQVFEPYIFFKNLFEIISPDIIISTISPKSEKAALMAGNELGILTISIDDLFGNHFKHKPVAKFSFVMSDFVKKVYEESEYNDTRVLVTGNPYMEQFYNEFKLECEGEKSQNVILFLYQNLFFDLNSRLIYPIDKNKCINLLNKIQELYNKKGYVVKIRNHPNLSHNDKLIIDGIDNFDSISLNEAMSKSEIIVGFDSTVLLQSVVLNKEIWEIKINGLNSTLDLYNKNLAKRIYLEDFSKDNFIECNTNLQTGKDINYYIQFENAIQNITKLLIDI